MVNGVVVWYVFKIYFRKHSAKNPVSGSWYFLTLCNIYILQNQQTAHSVGIPKMASDYLKQRHSVCILYNLWPPYASCVTYESWWTTILWHAEVYGSHFLQKVNVGISYMKKLECSFTVLRVVSRTFWDADLTTSIIIIFSATSSSIRMLVVVIVAAIKPEGLIFWKCLYHW